jgi:DNA invertase Pin-like site-specific DNA recombinase
MTETAPKRAAGYIRVSQERNARNGYGLDAQEAEVRRYAEYRRLQFASLYREAGVSGYERERPELERLLADAKAGKFEVVVFPSIDRAGRSVKDVIEIDATLRAAGVEIVFLREGIDTATPTGELYRNIMAAVAQFEGRLIHERLSKGRRAKAARGGYTGGWLPYGYRLEGGRAVVVPAEGRVVGRIFQWRAAGSSLEWIAARLNSDGVPTRRNGKWRVSTVRGMLGNPFYAGCVKFEGEPIQAQHDTVVAEPLFSAASAHVGGAGSRRPARILAGKCGRIPVRSGTWYSRGEGVLRPRYTSVTSHEFLGPLNVSCQVNMKKSTAIETRTHRGCEASATHRAGTGQ